MFTQLYILLHLGCLRVFTYSKPQINAARISRLCERRGDSLSKFGSKVMFSWLAGNAMVQFALVLVR